MKNLLSLLLLIVLFISCKKDDSVTLRFSPNLASQSSYFGWDSIDYTTIHYSYSTELKSPEDKNNPDIYNHSVNIDLRKDFLTADKGQAIIIKKFDIISKFGNVMLYIPYEGQPGADQVSIKLPYAILMNSSMSLAIYLVRYPNQ